VTPDPNWLRSLAYRARVQRGLRILAAGGVELLEVDEDPQAASTNMSYTVPSESRPEPYTVVVSFDTFLDDKGEPFEDVSYVRCDGPDWDKQRRRLDEYEAPGTDPVREPAFIITASGRVPICKHTIAVLADLGWQFGVPPAE